MNRFGNGVHFKNNNGHKKWQDKGKINKHEGGRKDKALAANDACYRCGSFNHWAKLCRTPKHLVDLYQQSVKNKGIKVEANLVYDNDNNDNYDDVKEFTGATHLEVGDFLANE